jgi:putative nucleotidyltransferase with HDIG domain
MPLNWLHRQKLVKKGLACDKTRHSGQKADWVQIMEEHTVVRSLIFLSFALLIALLSLTTTRPLQREVYVLLSIVFGYSILILHLDLPDIWKSNSRIILVHLSIGLHLLITRGLYFFSQHQETISYPTKFYLVPMTFAPLVLSILLGTRVGLYAVILPSLFDSLLFDKSFPLMLTNLMTGLTAVLFTRNVRKRSHLLNAGIAVGVCSVICSIIFTALSGRSMDALIQQASINIVIGLATAMVVNSTLPIFESVFNITPEISWVETADLNHPLLRQLTLEAPGTYHHSLMVANLAESAATAIGANATQCRVIAYFHDIGKIPKAEYFSENIPQGEDPHADLSPSMSALIIISHVKEGVSLAYKHRLKKPIIEAIQQHHGDSLVYYFYKRAKQQEEDAKAGSKILHMHEEDIPAVSESSFRYPGPRPRSKEVAILMLADAIESASRSLEKPNPQRIEGLVKEIIEHKMLNRQLDESPLSLQEINLLKESFTLTLKSMLHGRISYPKEEKSAASSQSSKKTSAPDSAAAA